MTHFPFHVKNLHFFLLLNPHELFANPSSFCLFCYCQPQLRANRSVIVFNVIYNLRLTWLGTISSVLKHNAFSWWSKNFKLSRQLWWQLHFLFVLVHLIWYFVLKKVNQLGVRTEGAVLRLFLIAIILAHFEEKARSNIWFESSVVPDGVSLFPLSL